MWELILKILNNSYLVAVSILGSQFNTFKCYQLTLIIELYVVETKLLLQQVKMS